MKRVVRPCFSVLLLAVHLSVLISPEVAWSSGRKALKQNKRVTKDMSLYARLPSSSPVSIDTESELLTEWNSTSRDEIRSYSQSLMDLNQVLELNRVAAKIWEQIRDCNPNAKTADDVEVVSRIAYLQGLLCPGHADKNKDLQSQIRSLQNQIETFASTTWIGGNDLLRIDLNKGKPVELPAAHPFFAQLLMERASVRLSAWSTDFSAIEYNPMEHLRETDNASDSRTVEANMALGNLLLLGALPKTLGSDRGGFYSCPALGVINIALDHFRGEAGWRQSILDLKQELLRACRASQAAMKIKTAAETKWEYLNVYHWLAIRYGAHRPKSTLRPNWSFTVISIVAPGAFLTNGVNYKGKRYMALEYTVLVPMVVAASILKGETLPYFKKTPKDPDDP